MADSLDTTHLTSPAPAHGSGKPSRTRRKWVLLTLGLVLILLVVLGAAAFGGYQAGVVQRQAQWQATQVLELENQYALGLADLQSGRYEVAVARFEYVLQLDPSYRDASARLAEAQAGAQLTPVAPASAAAPTAVVTPTPAPTESQEAAEVFALANTSFSEEDWDGVISALTRLHSVDPDYEAVRADGMLFLALRNRGVARIMGDAMEAGIYDLQQAEAFGPLDMEALNVRAWARTYLAGRSFWGLDWQRSMEIFEELSLIAPYFRDTDRRLFESVWRYADQLVAAGDYCGAVERYERALLLFVDENVSAKLLTAQEGCANPPPPDPAGTPSGDVTPTGDVTPPPPEGTPSP
jgi:tetratricopeptide (TPR) repeat protein